jgi:hypothetical protein
MLTATTAGSVICVPLVDPEERGMLTPGACLGRIRRGP